MKYSKELKASVLKRMTPPSNESIPALAEEFRVTPATLYAWRREAQLAGLVAPGNDRASDNWSAQSKFAVVLETAPLSQAELAEYCRSKGLFPEQIAEWKALAMEACSPARARADSASRMLDKKRIRKLESQLLRKDKALAEAAALLVLSKKAQAIWGEEDE